MQPEVSPDNIIRYMSGHWAAATLAAAVIHSIFTHIDSGHTTPEAIALAGKLSLRGVRALCDGLVGLGLLERVEDGYRNTREASVYLVEGSPRYIGAVARRGLLDFDLWKSLPKIVHDGGAGDRAMNTDGDDPRWGELGSALAPITVPVAEAAARHLGFAKAGARRVLDVGGGSGMFAAVLLRANREARATQIDFPSVNRLARRFVTALGVGERFETIDGNYREVELAEAAYDVVVLSQVTHMESPDGNQALFSRLKRALAPGGTLIIGDIVIEDSGAGPPVALLFQVYMLVMTREGATYRVSDYRGWLAEAGYTAIEVEATAGGTLIFARVG
jgi:SAM-dependent methyltransferase